MTGLGPMLAQAMQSIIDAERRGDRYVGYGAQPTFASRSGMRIPWRLMAGLADRSLVVVACERDKFGGRAWVVSVTAEGRKALRQSAGATV